MKLMKALAKAKAKVCEIETQEVEPIPPLYFGYGSNLDIFQMRRRCEDSVPVQAARLPGYQLTFSGVLTVEQVPDTFVLGGLYEVSYQDEVALDVYEGYPHLYTKRFTYATVEGKLTLVFFYVLEPPYSIYAPGDGYYETVEQGYRDWGLDVKELEASRKRALSVRKSYYELAASSWTSQQQLAWAEPVTATGELDEDGVPLYELWDGLSNL